jgi:hypothetical protein
MNFNLVGDGYNYTGWFENTSWISGLDSISGHRKGKIVFNFDDGGLISVKDGNMIVEGTTSRAMHSNFIGEAIITDHINGLVAEMLFNPKDEGAPKGMFSSFKKKFFGKKGEEKKRVDFTRVNICRYKGAGAKKQKEIICSGEGSFVSHLQFNDDMKIYWKYGDTSVGWTEMNSGIIPSDSTKRLDLVDLLAGRSEEAEKAKVELEQL